MEQLIPNPWQFVVNGLAMSAFYCLFAVGMSLVFGVMKIVNMAHGELYMLGAYLVWLGLSIAEKFAVPMIPAFFVVLVVAIIIVGGVGVAIERAVFRRLHGNVIAGYMASLGLVYILQCSTGHLFGFKDKSAPNLFATNFKIAGASLSAHRVVTVIIAGILMSLLWIFLNKANLGRGVRASSQDSEAASLQGIGSHRMATLVMCAGAVLAAAAGGLVGTTFLISPYMGTTVLWKAFIITIVGGMGSIGGAIVAAFVFGFLDNFVSTVTDPRMVILVDVVIMLVILAFRPQGLLGREK